MDETMESAQRDIQEYSDLIYQAATDYGLPLLAAILILIVGFWVAGLAQRTLTKTLDRTGKIDPTITLFAGSMAKYLVIILTVMAVLDQFGIETTSLVALIGAAGLAVGLALQGTLTNVAAGVMLLFFRPFKVGQYVEAGGVAGTVNSISLFTTHLDTGDNVHIIVPNGDIWGASIKNFSHNETRRVELNIGIDYGDDIDKAMAVVSKVLTGDERTQEDPAPLIVVGGLGDSSVDLLIRFWCAAGDFSALRWDMTKAIKEAFDKEGISIPYPHRVIQHIES